MKPNERKKKYMPTYGFDFDRDRPNAAILWKPVHYFIIFVTVDEIEFEFLAIRRMHLASAFTFYRARSWYLRIACASHGFAISPGLSMQAVLCVMNFTLNGCDVSDSDEVGDNDERRRC